MDRLWILLFLVPHVQSVEKLIIISIDGMRWSYLNPDMTPFLSHLAENGVSSNQVYPIFPSKTFPNHHAIATGMWAENHGIIDNKFLELKDDQETAKGFHKDNLEERWWNPTGKIVPIYIANEIANAAHKTASVMFPGSSVTYSGKNVSYFQKFDKKMNSQDRLKLGLDLILSGQYNLVMIYLDEIDTTEHKSGTLYRNIYPIVFEVDKHIESFYKAVYAKYKDVNVIITGDHGFSEIDPAKIIKPSSLLASINAEVEFDGTFLGLIPRQASDPKSTNEPEKIVKKLKEIADDRYWVYERNNIPDTYHFKKYRHIPPIVIIAKNGYYIDIKNESPPADHGWCAVENPDMRTIFIGRGPRFSTKIKISRMSITDIYPISCKILEK